MKRLKDCFYNFYIIFLYSCFCRHVGSLNQIQEVRELSLPYQKWVEQTSNLLLQKFLKICSLDIFLCLCVCVTFSLLRLLLHLLLLLPLLMFGASLSVLLQPSLLPGLDKVVILYSDVVSCRMTQRPRTMNLSLYVFVNTVKKKKKLQDQNSFK